MSDQPDNLTLVYLRRLDSKMDRLFEEIVEEIAEIKLRMTTVEVQIGGLAATEQSHYASLASRLDRVDRRLERLERRADIIEAPAS